MMKDEGMKPGKKPSIILKIEEKNVLVYEEIHNVTIHLDELQ